MTATRPQTIGILTGGGDVPGLNPCIKQLVVRAAQLGIAVKGAETAEAAASANSTPFHSCC